MYDYYDFKKVSEIYNQNYYVLKSKRKPRLSEIEIDGQISDDIRKKLIKILGGEIRNV